MALCRFSTRISWQPGAYSPSRVQGMLGSPGLHPVRHKEGNEFPVILPGLQGNYNSIQLGKILRRFNQNNLKQAVIEGNGLLIQGKDTADAGGVAHGAEYIVPFKALPPRLQCQVNRADVRQILYSFQHIG